MLALRSLSRLLLPAVLASAAATGSAEEVYRWKDARGVTHYSATPPAGTTAQPLTLSPPPAATAGPSARERLQRELEAANRSAAEQRERELARAERRDARRDRLQRCGLARQQIGVLESGAPVYGRDAAGKRDYLDAEQRQAALARARAEFHEACQGIDADSVQRASRNAARDVRDNSRCLDLRERLAALTRPAARTSQADIDKARAAADRACAAG